MAYDSQVGVFKRVRASRRAKASLQPPRPLTEKDAIDIWIARWLRIRRTDLLARYGCDPRRLYEIWEGVRFPGSRERALKVFAERHPNLTDRIDFGRHRRVPRGVRSDLQPGLFDSP